jgi:dTDP-glucose pyrophosphorylase
MESLGMGFGLALVVDGERHLLGTVTDGDVRRAILAGVDLDQPVAKLLEQPRPPKSASPLTAAVGTPDSKLLQMMADSGLRHVPLVDDTGRVEDVAVLDELVRDFELPVTAVVMAGGFGRRLGGLTEEVPKPMLPLGDRPLLEHIVNQLRTAGLRKLNISTHYKGHVIQDHFGDGSDFGVDIRYLDEKEPLGTAGAVGGLEESTEPVLVINGDVVTRLDFRAMLDFHKEHDAEMTVAVRQQEYAVPFGVVDIEGVELTGIVEKPTHRYMINAGVYLLGPEACRSVPLRQRSDMTDLICSLLSRRLKVVGFPVQEYWIDVGNMEDYEQAQVESDRDGPPG